MNFLADTNVCGQTLLRIVCRGNAIAELLRLSKHIPPVFRLADKETQQQFGSIILDFGQYLNAQERYEHIISSSAQLMDLDEEFRENHIEILKRFYNLFESIYKYIKDFIQYLDDLEAGVFIQHTLEGILRNNDGKQLVSEAIFLYGVIMILMDELIEGPVRERLLVSYLRYKGQNEEPLMDEVFKLCKRTGFVLGQKKPPNYPEEYLARLPIPKEVVNMVIGRLRSDDIYNQIAAYPLPEHRSTALANQACMLYIILYFAPNILHEQNAIMREIVDKHFPDNWVISYYLGFTIDLSIVWEGYKAAKAALANTVNMPNVLKWKDFYLKKVDQCQKVLDQYLTEGVLTEEYILDNLNKLLAATREANVTIRWLMLHLTSQEKKIKQVMTQDANYDKILVLLLNTAQFEFTLRNLFNGLLKAKQIKWEGLKKECSERMNDMSKYFSGEVALTRVKRNETLMKWFAHIAAQIDGLDYSDYVLAGRKIAQLIQALERVEEFQEVEQSLQVRQFLIDTRNFLHQMLRTVNVKDEVLDTLGIISDISYAWQIINQYVKLMQRRIKDDPRNVLKLRATFLKLNSILQLPLIRIGQAGSPDFFSVSEYYSSELVDFVRRVLEIVPLSMFEFLDKIIQLQTSQLKELPSKVDKDKLDVWGQLDLRYELAFNTHSISMFTEGILAMETTLVGVIKVEPKQLLEDGIRKQLVNKIVANLDTNLRFADSPGNVDVFHQKLQTLASLLDGTKRSFQYMSDYINIYGLKIWQEEFSRIINYNVEQECNSFLTNGTQISDYQSMYQSVAIPIPTQKHFIARVIRELRELTDYQKTLYIDPRGAWYDKDGREIVGMKTFDLLLESVGVFGVAGIDKLLAFMTVRYLKSFFNSWRRELNQELKVFMSNVAAQLNPVDSIPKEKLKLYPVAIAKFQKLWQPLFLDSITRIGQMQLLRKQIANTLNHAAKLDSNQLYCSLKVMNQSLIKDIQEHYLSPDTKPYPDDENPLLAELADYLDTCGLADPFTKIYLITEPIAHVDCFIFLFVLSQVTKFEFNAGLSTLVHKKDRKPFDCSAFVVGIITVLKQFHNASTSNFLAYLGQYVRYSMDVNVKKEQGTVELPEEVNCTLLFLEAFLKYSSLDRKVLDAHLPPYIFDDFHHSTAKE